ncbi:MAG: Xaa-Pro peptidase family protein [Planctomycetota bacterium]
MPKRAASKKTSAVPDLYRSRLAAVRKRLKAADLDGLLVSHAPDIRYLTGFHGEDSWAIIPSRGAWAVLVSDSRFTTQIGRDAPWARLVLRKGAIAKAAATTIHERELMRVGLQPGSIALAQRHALVKAVGRGRLDERFDDGLLVQRAVKTADEVKTIRKAVRIQQQAFTEMLELVVPGAVEAELAPWLEHRMRSLGADGPSFHSIVAADANAALPHAIPGRKKCKAGGIVLVDWGAKYEGYCSDLTRVVALGKMSRKMREVYQVVLDAQLAGIDAIRPGVKFKDVDAAARKVIDAAGYGEHFGHGLGHGIGLEIHEQPVLASRAQGVLEPGHVVTVEPGVYLPGVGGVRIEDDVLVTPKGHKVLSDLPKDLASAIL